MDKVTKSFVLLLISLALSCLIVSSVRANPFFYGGKVSPPAGVNPPKIDIALVNNSVLLSNNTRFKVSVSGSEPVNVTDKIANGEWFLTDVWYTMDWKEGNGSVYHLNMSFYSHDLRLNSFFRYVNLTNISEGNHTIKFFAVQQGTYVVGWLTKYLFYINSSSMVNFVIDTILPTVTYADAKNQTYNTRELAINFTINKPECKISYSLDNQSLTNTTYNKSIKLSDLSGGKHNLTIHATDKYGVQSLPSVSFFVIDVPKPFPAVDIIAISSDALIIFVSSLYLII